MMEDQAMTRDKVISPTANPEASNSVGKATDVSNTNLQVLGVDEPELIKTDGANIYFYNTKDHSVYIAKAFPATELKVLKKIKLPTSFSNPELFLSGKKLVILSTKYNSYDYGYRYWFNRQTKSAVVVYDISDINSLKMDRYYETDGNITESRMIGKYLYVLSSSSFTFPYPLYYGTDA